MMKSLHMYKWELPWHLCVYYRRPIVPYLDYSNLIQNVCRSDCSGNGTTQLWRRRFGTISVQIESGERCNPIEQGSRNFNYLEYLIVEFHPGYPKKHSLLTFGNVLVHVVWSIMLKCTCSTSTLMHKVSFYTNVQVPFFSHTILTHKVLKYWRETQATSTKIYSGAYWSTPCMAWLGQNWY